MKRLCCLDTAHSFILHNSERQLFTGEHVQVSLPTTEAELTSPDAGLRMDGISALNLWDVVIEVFHSSPNQINKSKGQELQGNLSRNTTLHMKNQNPTKHVNLDLNNVDHVSSNVRSSRFGAMLYEAVIKMIRRSPTTRHVSRTHRVALDWLFDRVNLDPKFKVGTSTPNINSQIC